ncbi:hypothetical protein [Granulicella sp. S156]|uniref:hypothetical protein n=1 Tax=Granulicella sp. S156 TaxID=1747224 RepID=UPI00131E200F|nr:hypothetical protein [Granulicella sp. S156]
MIDGLFRSGPVRRMADANLLTVELLNNHFGKLGQLQTGSDVRGWFADLGRNLLQAVLRLFQVEQPFEAPRLFEWMHVAALEVGSIPDREFHSWISWTTRFCLHAGGGSLEPGSSAIGIRGSVT